MKNKTWKKIFYNLYEINRQGTIRRIAAAQGTHVGRILTPYRAHKYSLCNHVALSRPNGSRLQTTTTFLVTRAFRRT